ncbi:MAG: DNA/RNA nuclease SfsA [Gammaproteobacteria bacterium]|nr:DNA/RNA nuclease SfsA [Gammaproteobacteria bacterium]
MKFEPNLIPATLIRRYKRFLADVELDNGEQITVHTPNTGSMLGLTEPGSRIWLRDADSPKSKRKYRYSWEIASTSSEASSVQVCVNTHLANKLVVEGIGAGQILELQGYTELRTEVKYGQENSRIDILLQNQPDELCYIEVKNVTAALQPGVAAFPDAVTTRGSKHLRELMNMVEQGHRAVIFFCVVRPDVDIFQPADSIDPVYGQLLREAVSKGIEALAYRAYISDSEIFLEKPLPVNLPDLL